MIITLGRQHGTGGHDVARLLANQLGIACYSKEIVDEAASDSNFSREIFKTYDEKRVSSFVIPTPHYASMYQNFQLNMQVASAQFDTIRRLADKGDCVFVGRCADYVLRNRPDLVRVFIMGSVEQRIDTIAKRKGISTAEAKKLVKEVDKDRASYYRYYTDQEWGETANYDLCLDASKIGVEGSVEVLKTYLKARGLL